MPNVPCVTIDVPPEFKPLIADVIVMWSNLDDHMEGLRRALQAQPQCQLLPAYDGAPFVKRLNNLENLAAAYFDSARFLLQFVRETCNEIRIVKGERDLVSHGRYGTEVTGRPPSVHLRLWDEPGGADRARLYSLEKFKELATAVGRLLARIRILAFDQPPSELAVQYWTAWGISKHKVSRIETLLAPLRAHRHAAIKGMNARTFSVFLPPGRH